MKLSVRTKLLGSAGVLLVIMGILSAMAVATYSSNGDAMAQLRSDNLVTEHTIATMTADFFQLDGGLNMHLLVKPDTQAEKDSWQTYLDGLADFQKQRDALAASELGPEMTAQLAKVDAAFTSYMGSEKAMETDVAAGNSAAAIKAITEDNNDSSNALQNGLTALSQQASAST